MTNYVRAFEARDLESLITEIRESVLLDECIVSISHAYNASAMMYTAIVVSESRAS